MGWLEFNFYSDHLAIRSKSPKRKFALGPQTIKSWPLKSIFRKRFKKIGITRRLMKYSLYIIFNIVPEIKKFNLILLENNSNNFFHTCWKSNKDFEIYFGFVLFWSNRYLIFLFIITKITITIKDIFWTTFAIFILHPYSLELKYLKSQIIMF